MRKLRNGLVGKIMEYGCIGERLSHSFSKIIHNELADYDYRLVEVAREALPDFMKKADFKAINVTIPYKEAVIPYLYKIDTIAEKIGAVNTVVNKNGKLYGYNTDFSGLCALINREKISLENKKVAILGSGGTSKTAYAAAQSLGASEIHRVSRSGGKGLITYNELYEAYRDTEIIINTTPCGMYPKIGEKPLDISAFSKLCGVIDVIYNPLSSALVVDAKKRGIPATGGLYMLVSQAVFAAEKFIDTEFDYSITESVYKKIYTNKHNIVLTGMPSCGKRIAEDFSKEFIDTDEEIEKYVGASIPEIISKEGVDTFREYESRVIKQTAAKQNCVIATGGGAVLRQENVDLLKQNGSLIFIDRPLEFLISTDDRPLSSSRKDLELRYKERYGIYLSSADFVLKVNKYDEMDIKRLEEAYINEILGN